jgi:hypothetical protein
MSAPRARRYSAAGRCPPWQAPQNARVMASPGGVSALLKCASTRSISPSVAASVSVVRAPRSTSRRAASHCPNPHASASGEPPPITPPAASISAPASINASTTATSLLLAAQCSGVSLCEPTNREAVHEHIEDPVSWPIQSVSSDSICRPLKAEHSGVRLNVGTTSVSAA